MSVYSESVIQTTYKRTQMSPKKKLSARIPAHLHQRAKASGTNLTSIIVSALTAYLDDPECILSPDEDPGVVVVCEVDSSLLERVRAKTQYENRTITSIVHRAFQGLNTDGQ